VSGRNFHIKERSMQENFIVLCVGAAESAEPTSPVGWADSETSGSSGQLAEELPNQPNLIFSNDTTGLDDWRTPILRIWSSKDGYGRSLRTVIKLIKEENWG
jgi:hypothetical protein